MLDAFEYILNKPGADVNTWRPRVEHAQIFQPSDLERIGRLGGWFTPRFDRLLLIKPSPTVIASVQPTHAYVPCLRSSRAMTLMYALEQLI